MALFRQILFVFFLPTTCLKTWKESVFPSSVRTNNWGSKGILMRNNPTTSRFSTSKERDAEAWVVKMEHLFGYDRGGLVADDDASVAGVELAVSGPTIHQPALSTKCKNSDRSLLVSRYSRMTSSRGQIFRSLPFRRFFHNTSVMVGSGIFSYGKNCLFTVGCPHRRIIWTRVLLCWVIEIGFPPHQPCRTSRVRF